MSTALPITTEQQAAQHMRDHQALLCVHHIAKTFPGMDRPVVDDVTFCVHAGEVFGLVGPSGCGKTTTLRLICGFESADAGEVLHDGHLLQAPGKWVPPEKRGIGFVFQDYALFPHLNVLRNVAFGIRHVPRKRRPQVAREALWMVGLMDYGHRMPHDLSGGQQQRVALARAIAAGSKVILLDEPFSSLDPDLRHATRSEIRALAERAKLALVLVTHDQEEALSTSDRLAVMNDGKLLQTGEPEEVYNRPATAFVAQFLGRTNLLEAQANGRYAECELGRVGLDREAQGNVTLSLRPEHLELHSTVAPHVHAGLPDDSALAPGAPHLHAGLREATITSREFKGHDMTYRVRLGKRELTVQTDHRAPHHIGDKVTVTSRCPAAIVEA